MRSTSPAPARVAPARQVRWVSAPGRNAELQRAREAAPRIFFGFSPRDPARYVAALPPLPLFRTAAAAQRAAASRR
jgi:hypothetical protein